MTRDSIRALVDAATEGPWEWDDAYVLAQPGEHGMNVMMVGTFDNKPDAADRAFIAASRTAVPLLLACADALALHNLDSEGGVVPCLPDCIACSSLAALEAIP